MSRRVRVIRVLEYSYPDQETYEADIARWYIPPNGVGGSGARRGGGVVIRSATTLVETLPEQEES